jgi:hypothetical protein
MPFCRPGVALSPGGVAVVTEVWAGRALSQGGADGDETAAYARVG